MPFRRFVTAGQFPVHRSGAFLFAEAAREAGEDTADRSPPIGDGFQEKKMAFLNCTDRALSAQTVDLFRERPSGRLTVSGSAYIALPVFPTAGSPSPAAGGQVPAFFCIHPEFAVNMERETLSSLAVDL